jgi:hypothetical protein
MEAAIKITVVDPEDYYFGVEIHAWTRRYSGGTRVFVGDDLEALSQFCARISGFPARGDDDRESQFGTTTSGGYCRLRFRTVDAVGHAVVDVELDDDISLYSDASAKFSFRVDAAAVDRFIQELRDVVRDRIGEAVLEGSV